MEEIIKNLSVNELVVLRQKVNETINIKIIQGEQQMQEYDLMKRYDLKYDQTQCREYKIGVIVEFEAGKEKRTGTIFNIIHNPFNPVIIYEVAEAREGYSFFHKLKRSEILGLAKPTN
jgi:hypothetical protein